MTNKTNPVTAAAVMLAVCVLSVALTTMLMQRYVNYTQFELLADILGSIIAEHPNTETELMAALKAYKEQPEDKGKDNILTAYGYTEADFHMLTRKEPLLFAGAAALSGGLLLLALWYPSFKKREGRIRELTGYLERINTDREGMLIQNADDAFGGLQDELYKTVTALFQTREEAVRAKENYAENLANIAHQLKTPITALSLQTQMLKEEKRAAALTQMEQQLHRLQYLEEALLLLARVDAGTLSFEEEEVDAFTVLTLAADNLQELLSEKKITVEIPEREEMTFTGDLDWTMEALMNLMKNCIEHAKPGSCIHCEYERNPLYLELRIFDEGDGFSKEDLPHLFDRFYTGKGGKGGGIGIGLPLARAIFERENGVISASNLTDGGACFEVRIYRH